MKHLYSNRCHDESEVWCGDHGPWETEPTVMPEETTCVECVDAARSFGNRAWHRGAELMQERLRARFGKGELI